MTSLVEEWRPIGDWPYEASSFGQVRRKGSGVLKSRPKFNGYLILTLYDMPRHRQSSVAWCVARAFHGPRPDGMHVAHLDGNRLNNTADNLAYVTPKENASHKLQHGTLPLGERHHQSKLTQVQVDFIRKHAKAGDQDFGARALARLFGIDNRTVADVIEGKGWNPSLAASRTGQKGAGG